MAAAYSRKTLAATVNRYSRHRFNPCFSHLIYHDGRENNHGEPRTIPSSLAPTLPQQRSLFNSSPTVKSFCGNRSYSLGIGAHFSVRSYSSSAEGSGGEIELIKDVSEVLTDAGTTIPSSATSIPASVPGEVAAAAADSFLPIAALQFLIDGVHSLTGLNWWAAIALTTVLIRTATVPLLINQMRATFKLNKMRPELEELKEQMQNSMDPKSVQEGQQKMKALFLKHGVTPFTPLKGMFIQGPVFICFFLAISNMVEKVPSFKNGGVFWFTDLTTPDPMYILPVLTSLTFLTTVELNMQEGMEGNPMANTMKNFSRVLALLTIPFTASFPKAIFFYWMTSNIFSLGYGYVMRRPAVRSFLNLPDQVPMPASAPPTSFSFFSGPKSIAPAASPLQVEQPEKPKFQERKISSSSVISQRIRNLEKTVKGRSKPKKR